MGNLGLPLPAAGDLGIGVGPETRRVHGVAEDVAIGFRVAAIELADDGGELAGDVFDLADPPRGDRVPHREDLRVVVPRVADDQLDLALVGERGKGARVRRVDGHRLLEEKMETAVEHRPRQGSVGRMRDGDDRPVEPGLIEHLGRIGEDSIRGDPEALGGPRPVLDVGIRDPRDHGVGIGDEGGKVGAGRPPAAADDADPRAHASSA